jgi:uncharacterized protein (DUF4415 family)
MQKSERIVRYTAEELEEKLRRGEDLTDWAALDALTEEELEASIDFEEEGYPIWETAMDGIPEPKQQITVRFDEDVIAWFKAQGPGYQARMNAALRGYVEAERQKARAEINVQAKQ